MSESEEEINSTSEIYLVTCIPTGLKYVGGTSEGVKVRWQKHISDAAIEKRNNLNCSIFHQDINKYGPRNFTIEKIIDCDTDMLDDVEQIYVELYDTLHPNGYNMSTGGRKTTFCELARQNMSAGQIGKRYNHEIERKRQEDNDLPKNITPIREKDIIIGYQIKKFPMGTDKKDYVYKTFKNKANPAQALTDATAYLEFLKIEYAKKLELKQEEKECKELAATLNLPDNIFPNKNNGYFVKGLKDYVDNDIPRRDFQTLEEANNFITKVNEYNTSKKLPFSWSIINLSDEEIENIIPNLIENSMMCRRQNGYIVKYIESYDDNKKPIQIIQRFTNAAISLQEKHASAIEFVKNKISDMNI